MSRRPLMNLRLVVGLGLFLLLLGLSGPIRGQIPAPPDDTVPASPAPSRGPMTPPPPAEFGAAAPSSGGVNLEDPEASATRFVERSTREADEAIKVLSQEAETLRARLKKVEAGLLRWQGVKRSLSERQVDHPEPPIGAQETIILDPLPPGQTRPPSPTPPAEPR